MQNNPQSVNDTHFGTLPKKFPSGIILRVVSMSKRKLCLQGVNYPLVKDKFHLSPQGCLYSFFSRSAQQRTIESLKSKQPFTGIMKSSKDLR